MSERDATCAGGEAVLEALWKAVRPGAQQEDAELARVQGMALASMLGCGYCMGESYYPLARASQEIQERLVLPATINLDTMCEAISTAAKSEEFRRLLRAKA